MNQMLIVQNNITYQEQHHVPAEPTFGIMAEAQGIYWSKAKFILWKNPCNPYESDVDYPNILACSEYFHELIEPNKIMDEVEGILGKNHRAN